MRFYYRGKNDRRAPRSQAVMRIATLTALLAYPAGCVIQLMFPDTTPEPGLTGGEIGGFALIGLSLLAFGLIAPSWLQRIVGEEKSAWMNSSWTCPGAPMRSATRSSQRSRFCLRSTWRTESIRATAGG